MNAAPGALTRPPSANRVGRSVPRLLGVLHSRRNPKEVVPSDRPRRAFRARALTASGEHGEVDQQGEHGEDCEGSDAESTARSISKDDLLGLPKWTT